VANRALALGWALKGACKPCAQRLVTTARWLVPEAQRFLVQRVSSYNQNRRFFEWLLSRVQSRVLAGLLIVVAFVGSLNIAMRNAATDSKPLVENRQEPKIPSEINIVSVSESSEPMQDSVLETGSISGAQIAPVPLPLRKPERFYKALNGKGAKATPATKKRMAQKKSARPEPMR